MPTLREFFVTEAADIMAQMQKLIMRLDAGSTDHPELARLGVTFLDADASQKLAAGPYEG